MLNSFIGLASVMLANVLMGVTLAKLKKNFNKKKMLEGLVKVGGVLIAVGLLYLTSRFNSKVTIFEFSTDLTLSIRILTAPSSPLC